ncbi:hypothetical protein KLNKPBOH_03322 [Aeromonas veronii]
MMRVLLTLLNRLRHKVEQVSADGAYDTKECHALQKKESARATIPPRKNAALREEVHSRNEAVKTLKAGNLNDWKGSSGYPISVQKPRQRCIVSNNSSARI